VPPCQEHGRTSRPWHMAIKGNTIFLETVATRAGARPGYTARPRHGGPVFFGASFTTNASGPPLSAAWAAPFVVGKSFESVLPTT